MDNKKLPFEAAFFWDRYEKLAPVIDELFRSTDSGKLIFPLDYIIEGVEELELGLPLDCRREQKDDEEAVVNDSFGELKRKPEKECENDIFVLKADINWELKDKEYISSKFKKLYGTLIQLAYKYDTIKTAELTEEEIYVWDTYINRYDNKHKYLLNADEIRARVGGKAAAWDLAYFTTRVCMIFNSCIKHNDFMCLKPLLNAPIYYLILALVLNAYADSVQISNGYFDNGE
ncbi:MAG: hypothetical protein E7271_00350 [Lachnospiraceae bacterium]|nr:hypothetical protein [Lachnospiraceae bacterium]